MNPYDMGKHAYETVPLYYNLSEKLHINIREVPFDALPVVDKSYYVGSGMSMISSKHISEYMGGRLQYTRTSGSTGKFSEVYWNKRDYARSLVSLWVLRRKYYHILPTDKLAYFFPADTGEEGYTVRNHAMAISRKYLSDGRLAEAYDKILAYDPVWMILQPSLALLLCDVARSRGVIPKSLRYIEFTGEYLEETVRKKVEDTFRCETANQYGTKEVNSIAYECPEGTLHIMQDNVYLETVGDPKEQWELCVTSLTNFAMPFVRFNLEDRGEIIRNQMCACGRCTDVLKLSAGRSHDWIQCEDGTKLHSYILLQIVHQINYETDGEIIQYRVIQKDYRQFEVILVLEEAEAFAEIAEYITERFHEKLGEDTEVAVHVSERLLPSDKTGKLAEFITEMG